MKNLQTRETLVTEMKAYFETSKQRAAVAYLVYSAKKQGLSPEQLENCFDIKQLAKTCGLHSNSDDSYFFTEQLRELPKERILRFFVYDLNDLKNYILEREYSDGDARGIGVTPKQVCRLALELLEVDSDDSVMDICAGEGNFLCEAAKSVDAENLRGIELNYEAALLAKIRCAMIDKDIYVIRQDVLHYQHEPLIINKIFAHLPFGLTKNFSAEAAAKNFWPQAISTAPLAWQISYKICNMLYDGYPFNGKRSKAVVIMSMGELSNVASKRARDEFLKNKYVRAVIKLPARIFRNTNVPCAMVVFTREENESIRFVDASGEYEEGRRINILSQTNINNIKNAVLTDTEISRETPIFEVVQNDSSFDPALYCQTPIEIENGVPFGSIITEVTRGASVDAEELDAISSKRASNIRYLAPSNIRNGVIEDDLPFLTVDPNRFSNYCVRKNDLVITKNGYPFKLAILDSEPVETVVASSNLYIVRFDTNVVDPHYVLAYLSGEEGAAQLKRLAGGSAVPVLSITQLKKLQIPLPSLDRQREIAVKFAEIIEEIKLYKKVLSKAEDRLKNLFEEEKGKWLSE